MLHLSPENCNGSSQPTNKWHSELFTQALPFSICIACPVFHEPYTSAVSSNITFIFHPSGRAVPLASNCLLSFSNYSSPTHPERLSQFKYVCLIKQLPFALIGNYLTLLCPDTMICPFLYSSTSIFFESLLVVYVSEIILGMQNTPGVGLLVIHLCSFLRHQHCAFYIIHKI